MKTKLTSARQWWASSICHLFPIVFPVFWYFSVSVFWHLGKRQIELVQTLKRIWGNAEYYVVVYCNELLVFRFDHTGVLVFWCFGVSLLRDRPGVFGVLVFRFCRQAWCFGVLVFRFCRQGWCFGVSVFRFLRVETPLRGDP